jgi:polysaccharide chain length determinant protein (PEP-CTERM system associated)
MNSIYEEFRVALHSIWKRRWLALLVAWGVSLIGWLVISTIPNRYESKASVFIQNQSLLPGKLGITDNERRDGIENITQTLTAADNLEKVVRRTDLAQLATSPRDFANLSIGLRKSIEVVAVQDNLFEISAESANGSLSNAQNAKLSRDIVQKLLDLFVEGNLAGDRVETAQALKYLDAQLAGREVELQAAEAKRVAFEQKYLGMLPGAGSPSQRLDAARAELGQIESSLMAASGGLNALNAQLASTPASTTTPSSTIGGSSGGGRAAAIEGQIAEGASRGWTESHPDMQALRRQLGSARAADRGSVTAGRVVPGVTTPNPMFATLRSMQAEKQASVAALSARKAQLQAEMGQYQVKQAQEPGIAAEQAAINRDYDVLKTKYDKLLADREEVRLRGSLQTDTNAVKLRVIEAPLLPTAPAAPNRPLLLALVLLGGLGAGAAAAFAMSQIKTSYATAGRLERASGLPVIGSVSEVTSSPQRAERRKKLRMFAGATMALFALFTILLVVEFAQRAMVA